MNPQFRIVGNHVDNSSNACEEGRTTFGDNVWKAVWILFRLRLDSICVTKYTDDGNEEKQMSRDLTSMDDDSLVTKLSVEALALGRTEADPTRFPGDQEKMSQHVGALESELKNRLRVPLIV